MAAQGECFQLDRLEGQPVLVHHGVGEAELAGPGPAVLHRQGVHVRPGVCSSLVCVGIVTIIAVLPPAVLHWARLGEVPQLRLGEAVDTAGCRWEDALSTTSGLVTRAAEVMAVAFKQISAKVREFSVKCKLCNTVFKLK